MDPTGFRHLNFHVQCYNIWHGLDPGGGGGGGGQAVAICERCRLKQKLSPHVSRRELAVPTVVSTPQQDATQTGRVVSRRGSRAAVELDRRASRSTLT